MSSPSSGSRLDESDAFLSPRSSDPFAAPDPLSDSDEEANSTIGRAARRARPRIQEIQDRLDLEQDTSSQTSTYREADSYGDSGSGTVKGVVRDEDDHDDDDDEPPQSLLYESTASDRDISPSRKSIQQSHSRRQPEMPDARRRAVENRFHDTRRDTAGSPFIAPVEDDETEAQVDERDLGSSSTPQPYERSRTRFTSTGDALTISPKKHVSGSPGSASPSTPHATLAQPSPMRGRSSGKATRSTTTSNSLSTFRSNSASPPPDLLESGSISSDLESLELGNNSRRANRRTPLAERDVQQPLLPMPVTSTQGIPPPLIEDRSVEAGPSRARGQGDAVDLTYPVDASKPLNGRDDARDDVNDPVLSSERKKKQHRRRRDKNGNRWRLSSRSVARFDSGQGDTGWMKDAGRNLSERERALWIWVNVVDLDGYLQEVYEYYVGKGLYCIALRRILNLLTSGFVIVFSTFLFSCVDYHKFPSDGHGSLSEVIVPHCSSRWSVPHIALTWVLGIVFGWRLLVFALNTRKLIEMKAFYEHLLDVPNSDIQTIPWSEVVKRIGQIRNDNPTTSLKDPDGAESMDIGDHIKLDAHDVANRILRQENYLTALFNKDLLDLYVRIPLPKQAAGLLPGRLVQYDSEEDRFYLCFGRNNLTRALEWNLRFCLLGYFFDNRKHVRKEFIRGRNRGEAILKLRNRFIFMGILNAIFAPFIVLYLLMYSFFRYFEEYHKNPSSIGSRQYTPYARWKFREFNELPHLFERRLDESYEPAKEYIDQFPKAITALIMRFIAFIAGAFAAVLLLLSVVDPVFLHFEITQDRSVLFYLGLFTSVLAVSRGMIPQDTKVFSPEELITEVVAHTHYMPDGWSDKLHSQAVHAEFSKLFEMKLSNFLQELISVLLTPFILILSLPRSAAAIVDFFREFTVHVDGIGYVCSFAVFDFKRQGKLPELPSEDEDARKSLFNRNRKMEKSFLHFKITNPAWQPSDPSASLFLSKVADSGNMRRGARRPDSDTSQKASQPLPAEEQQLRDRFNIYERALQRSIMLRSGNKQLPSSSPTTLRGVGRPPGNSKSAYLATMKEAEDGLEEADEEDGWETKMIKRKGPDLEYSQEEPGRRDHGVLDMLQDVIRR